MSYGSGLMDVVQSSTTGTPTQFNDGSGTQIGTLCRAWVKFNGTAGTLTTSFNVSSITKNSTGNWLVNFTNAMPDANYSGSFCVNTASNIANFYLPQTTNIQVLNYTTGGIPSDATICVLTIFR